MKIISSFGDRLKYLRSELNLSLIEMADIIFKQTGIKMTAQALNRYELAQREAKTTTVSSVATAFDVNPLWLSGYNIDMHAPVQSNENVIKIPLCGTIAAGVPITAIQNIDYYLCVPPEWHVDFALHIKGDSMIDLGIEDGSIALCKSQDVVENGQIAVCLIDGEEATLKRVYDDGTVISLIAANSKYHPRTFKGAQRKQVQIQGLCKKVIRDIY